MFISSRVWLILLAGLLGLLLMLGFFQAITSAPAAAAAIPEEIATPTPLADHPETIITSPDISFIDSPNPVCTLPRPGTGECYLTWSYLYASASPNYMITMTVEIDGQARGRFQGFFQNNMYIPAEMLNYQIACGAPGSGGDPNWGASHTYSIRGRDSAGLNAANYGQIFCPADIIDIYLPLIRK